MQYSGFPSISAYEKECARLGYTTRRIPFTGPAGECFALVTAPPGHPTGTSIEAWSLIDMAETTELLDGVISGGTFFHAQPMVINGKLETGYLDENGVDKNWLGKLAAHGYFPTCPQAAPAPSEPEYPVGEGGQICFPF